MTWLSPSRRFRLILNWVNEACDGVYDACGDVTGASEAGG